MQYKAWVRKVITEVSGRLNLAEWRIDVVFSADYPNGDDEVVAYIRVVEDYFKAKIHITPYAEELWKDEQQEILAECFVHELVHILVDPVYQFALKSTSDLTLPFLTTKNEQTTQKITRIVMELLPKKIFSRT